MIEYRTVLGTATEPDGTLNGMVTPFGVETVIGDMKRGGFKEEIAPGTFSKTLRERPVVLIHNHDTAMPMASTSVPDGEEGHLSLTPKPAGLMARALPFDTTYANDVRKTSKILGMSFGFEVTKDEWFDSEGRASNSSVGTKRVIREVKLHEVSTTAFPAYGSTLGTVSVRDTINAARGVEEARSGDEEPTIGDSLTDIASMLLSLYNDLPEGIRALEAWAETRDAESDETEIPESGDDEPEVDAESEDSEERETSDSETPEFVPEEEYRELFEAYFERTRNLVL